MQRRNRERDWLRERKSLSPSFFRALGSLHFKAGFQFGEVGRARRTIARPWSHNQFPVLAKSAPTSQQQRWRWREADFVARDSKKKNAEGKWAACKEKVLGAKTLSGTERERSCPAVHWSWSCVWSRSSNPLVPARSCDVEASFSAPSLLQVCPPEGSIIVWFSWIWRKERRLSFLWQHHRLLKSCLFAFCLGQFLCVAVWWMWHVTKSHNMQMNFWSDLIGCARRGRERVELDSTPRTGRALASDRLISARAMKCACSDSCSTGRATKFAELETGLYGTEFKDSLERRTRRSKLTNAA